jgi:thioredoxin 1
MNYRRDYAAVEPTRAEIDAAHGLALVEFGAPWCPHCIAAQAPLQRTLAAREYASGESIAHYKIEDGAGRPLGRSFRVKLWPTLILMRDGVEIARVVRPTRADEIERALFSQP